MLTLSQASQRQTRAYIFTYGRLLDRSLYAYHFEDGSLGAVLEALAAYQNEDGGFGRALEPDIRAPVSSAIATSTGLNILRAVGAPSSEPVVQKAVAYLMETFDIGRRVWPIIPPEVEQAPHAPWWSYADSDQTFGAFLANPRAALLGHLWFYGDLVPAAFLADLTPEVLARCQATPDGEMAMHDLYSYLELAEAADLPETARRAILDKLGRVAGQTVTTDPALWLDYNLTPLDVASTPDAPLAPFVDPAALEANLDFVIGRQLPDGSWPLAWSWAFIDAEAWAQAEQDWKGHKAVLTLRTLRAFGRLSGR